MNIPTIGGARGIFEILIPGVFFLLNIGAFVFSLPFLNDFLDDHTRKMIGSLLESDVLDAVVLICFGYLTGILLRLLRMDKLDRLSAWWLRVFDKKVRDIDPKTKKRTYRSSVTEGFPYIDWIGQVASGYLPPEASRFYQKMWEGRKRESNQNKQFFNFCKIVISSHDEKSANEIYAAESLTRYIAGMFYALFFASILIMGTIAARYLVLHEWVIGLFVLLVAYLFAMIIIIQRFRKMRIREVEVIFATSYKNRELFEEKKPRKDQ